MLAFGLFASATALGCLVFALLASPVARISVDRRGTEEDFDQALLTQFSDGIIKGVERLIRRRGWTLFSAQEIELAGLAISQSSLLVTVVSLSFTVLVVGALLIQNLLLEILLAAMVPVGAKMLLKIKSSKRRAAFADQLDSTLQMLSSALRAGHSFPRAIDAVSQEADSPVSEEFARIVNENRIGRDMVDGMRQTATRMRNEDFSWVADAVAIQRDTGGNLSEILDRVGGTIRERNEIRAQIHALLISTAGWSGKPRSNCPLTCPSAIIGCTSRPARSTRAHR